MPVCQVIVNGKVIREDVCCESLCLFYSEREQKCSEPKWGNLKMRQAVSEPEAVTNGQD